MFKQFCDNCYAEITNDPRWRFQMDNSLTGVFIQKDLCERCARIISENLGEKI